MIAAGALISGSGTNLQAIIDRIAARQLDCDLRLVVSNRPEAAGLARAEGAGVPTRVIDHRGFPAREDFDRAVVQALRDAGVELVVLAGFDRLISRVFLEAFPSRILNIHPALLPSFKGLHAQRQAVEYGVRIAGATVHFVDEQYDHGPIIVQEAVPVLDGDTPETLAARVQAVERRLVPEAVRLFAAGRLRIEGRRVRILAERE